MSLTFPALVFQNVLREMFKETYTTVGCGLSGASTWWVPMCVLLYFSYIAGDGVTVEYLSDLIATNTDEDWRLERNGRISELLMHGVRSEIRKRVNFDDAATKVSVSPIKMMSPNSSRMPAFSPEEIFITVEDVQNAIVNGM